MTTSFSQFFLPCVIILFCYISILFKLRGNRKRIEKFKIKKASRISTNKMLITMISIFTICWLPLNLLNISDDLSDGFSDYEYYDFLFFTSHLFAMSSVIYNPFIYTFNESFRKEFRSLFWYNITK